jgi:hypothetical protein
MPIEDNINEFRNRIVKLSCDEDEAASFVRMLVQTNWQKLFELDKRKMFLCDNCSKLLPRRDVIRGGYGKFYGQYCKDCCVRCPVCKTKHVGRPGQWLYPLCEPCINSVDRSVVDEERKTLYTQSRRAHEASVPNTLTLGEWIGTLINFSWMCAYCQTSPYEHCDHFLPISLGGGTTQSNCVPACKRCNNLKSRHHPNKIKSISQDDIIRVQNYLRQF